MSTLPRAESDAVEAMTLQIEDADGGLHTITRASSGFVETIDRPSAAADVGVVSRFGIDGSFALVGRDRSGGDVDPPEPAELSRRTNLYGIEIERTAYPGGLSVERTFAAEGRLARVRARGVWGSVTMDLESDGSYAIAWETARVRSDQRWSSTQDLVVSELRAG